MFGAGYASAQDRLFFMDVLRHTARARLTELIGPGDNDSTVEMDAEQLMVADYSEAELEQMIETASARAGAEAAVIQADLDAYVAGINAVHRRGAHATRRSCRPSTPRSAGRGPRTGSRPTRQRSRR